jgi:hypothetical protein
MKKNVSGQKIGAQMIDAATGAAFTSSVTVYVTGDAGTQAAGSVSSGACTHEGNGYHTYAPAQAETNYDLVAFTFTGTGAVPQTVQVYTSFPQTVAAPAAADIVDALYQSATSGTNEATAPKKGFYAAIAKLTHAASSSGGTLTVKRSDGTTTHFTQSETTDAAADPLTGLGGAA